ncbi:hypothetical protein C8R45DRAFT_215306 [Mycena sanguinolenta]|nr:hypothetical protein C8R45DRAFT_215306 [Mycena sanguinolenta]
MSNLSPFSYSSNSRVRSTLMRNKSIHTTLQTWVFRLRTPTRKPGHALQSTHRLFELKRKIPSTRLCSAGLLHTVMAKSPRPSIHSSSCARTPTSSSLFAGTLHLPSSPHYTIRLRNKPHHQDQVAPDSSSSHAHRNGRPYSFFAHGYRREQPLHLQAQALVSLSHASFLRIHTSPDIASASNSALHYLLASHTLKHRLVIPAQASFKAKLAKYRCFAQNSLAQLSATESAVRHCLLFSANQHRSENCPPSPYVFR